MVAIEGACALTIAPLVIIVHPCGVHELRQGQPGWKVRNLGSGGGGDGWAVEWGRRHEASS